MSMEKKQALFTQMVKTIVLFEWTALFIDQKGWKL